MYSFPAMSKYHVGLGHIAVGGNRSIRRRSLNLNREAGHLMILSHTTSKIVVVPAQDFPNVKQIYVSSVADWL